MSIKKSMEKEYEHYREINSQDTYSKACIEAGEKVMRLLDDGKSPEEAEKGLHGQGLTGFMAGAAIEGVVRFHERGEEMRMWWNIRYGVENAKGTVNPALVEITIT